MYDIMTFDRLKELRSRMMVVHEECFDQFVAGVIAWYQYEAENPPPQFYLHVPEEPPNAFNLLEYRDLASDVVMNLFHQSDIHHIMDHYGYDAETARNKAVEHHNNQPAGRDMLMMYDVEAVLNEYRLFYCYHDDANAKAIYRNPFVREVW